MREVGTAPGGRALLAALSTSLALTACTTGAGETALAPAEAASSASPVHPGGAVRTGAQTAGMAGQYTAPRAGTTAATGASAWVPPAPPPAFEVSDLPPADPPAPPPAAVANRQSAPRQAVDASQVVRPEAAPPQSPAPSAEPALSAATREEGRRLFASFSCNACHALADAGAGGAVGPSLDNPTLTRDYVIDVVTSGRGAMPSYAGQMSEAEIATLADYIVGSARR